MRLRLTASANFSTKQACSAESKANTWTPSTVLVPAGRCQSFGVEEKDVQRARQLIAEQLGTSIEDSPPRPIRYGMKSLLINVTLIAVIFGFYIALGAHWSAFALPAFLFMFLGNLLAFAYAYEKRRRLADEQDVKP